MVLVLVVDDRSVNRELLVTLLHHAGHSTCEADSGEGALLAARTHRPDLVILDQAMPDKEGLDVVRELRETPELAATPVLFYTSALTDAGSIGEASRLGVAAVLAKPPEPAAILATVERVLAASGRPSPPSGVPPDFPDLGLRLAHLVEIGLDLESVADPVALVEMFARRSRLALGADAVAVVLHHNGSARRHIVDGLGAQWSALDPALAPRDSFAPLTMTDVIARPITTASLRYGILLFGLQRGRFDETAERFASTLLTQLALAYENLQLREALREELRRSNELTNAVFECAPMAIMVLNSDATIAAWNKAAERMFGWKREELMGRTTPLTPKTARFETEALKERVLRGETITDFQTHHVRKDGSIIEVSISAAPLYGRDHAFGGAVAVFCDLTEVRRAHDQAAQRAEELAALSAHLVSAQEKERTRIAREIHDELGQLLTAAKLELLNPRGANAATASALLDQTVAAIRRIAAELRPSSLDDFGLVPAIENELAVFQQRTGLTCDLSCRPENIEIGRERATTLFRVLQEALTNVIRHADATRVEVRVRRSAGEMLLSVHDDGRGISDEALHSTSSLGLIGMRERVRQAGGTVGIEGIAQRGTILTVHIPLPHREEP